MTACKICGDRADVFDLVDFNKICNSIKYPLGLSGIPVVYSKCENCRFIFTQFFDDFSPEEWSFYIYNDEYVRVDPGYISGRPQSNLRQLSRFLRNKEKDIIGLDYGGGSGLTANLMNEAGYSFDFYDPFGHNELSFDKKGKYNFCSAMEVIEHSPNPVEFISDILSRCSQNRLIILIGTSTHDDMVSPETRLSWYYAAPRNGHISLFSKRSLKYLSERFGLNYVSASAGIHLMVRETSVSEAYAVLLGHRPLLRLSLTMKALGRAARLR